MRVVWGKKQRQVGGSGDSVSEQDYDSAFVDGQEISLYDFVYLSSDGPEPYVGIVVRLWENVYNKQPRVLVRWLYRPEDCSTEVEALAGDQELFLALGSGDGAEDGNDLDVVQGKCHCQVLYYPDGVENWKPTKAQIGGAQYYVSRCYDFVLDEVHCNLKEALERLGAAKLRPKRQPETRPEQPVKRKPREPSEKKKAEPVPEKRAAETNLKRAFKQLGWNDKLDDAFDRGKVILLAGFGAGYTAPELKEALMFLFPDIRHDLEVSMLPPKCCKIDSRRGEAVLAFRDVKKAQHVFNTIEQHCVTLSEDAGPCTATVVERPIFKRFPGHLPVEKYWRAQAQKYKAAVSTAHCSQPNTIEYEMAIEWRLMDEEHRLQIQALAKKQEQELADLKAKLKMRS